MKLTRDLGIARTTSSLNEVANDTGRVAFCGPYVLSAITGYPVSRIESEIQRLRGLDTASAPVVKGTYSNEVAATLGLYGYRMDLVESFMHLDRKGRPSVWTWMQKPRNAWSHYILGIHKGKEGHWILIKGVKLCDTYSSGKWQFVCDGPHRGAKIMEVFEVKRELLAATPSSEAIDRTSQQPRSVASLVRSGRTLARNRIPLDCRPTRAEGRNSRQCQRCPNNQT